MFVLVAMVRFVLSFLCFYVSIVFCVSLEWSSSQEKSEGPVVKTNYGLIRGFTMETETQREFYAFQGIPFAKPPVGELRFKLPVPIEPWDGTLQATNEGSVCAQLSIISSLEGIFGSEDCLFLNVYTPKLPKTEDNMLLPVLVVIHGGAFMALAGSIAFNGPKKFMDRDVVMVNFNYRLGPLGFLSTEDEASPGNYALFDQVMVLKWVNENIRYFGGNPALVTLMGQSAGSMSASAHLLSPLSKGLFHRLILESGLITAPLMINSHPKTVAVALGEAVGCSTNSTQQLVQCLLTKDAETLVDTAKNISFPNTLMVIPRFAPVVDGVFLPEHPQILLERGDYPKIPIISGNNRDEGITFYDLEKTATKKDNEIHFVEDFPFHLVNSFSPSVEEIFTTFPVILKEYFVRDDYHCLESSRRKINQLITDLVFNAPLINFVKLVSPNLKNFMYIFEHRSTFEISDFDDISHKNVVEHGAELKYLFDTALSLVKVSLEDTKISEVMMSLWSNFIKYGNPSPNHEPVQWNPVKSDAIEYLHITKNSTMKSRYRHEKVQIINEAFLKKIKKGLSLNNKANGQQISSDFKFIIEKDSCKK